MKTYNMFTYGGQGGGVSNSGGGTNISKEREEVYEYTEL